MGNRGYYSSDGVSEEDDISGNSNNQSPVNALDSQHPEDLDNVLHDALSSFTPITSTVPKKRGRPSIDSSTIEESSVLRRKRPKLSQKRHKSQSSEKSSATDPRMGHIQDSFNQREEPSLLKKTT